MIPATNHNNGEALVQVDAQAPTCTAIGWNAYEYCTECDYTTYEEIPATGHNNGEGLTKAEATEPTKEATGNNEYYYCDVCGTAFKDAEGTIPTTVEAETLPKIAYLTHEMEVVDDEVKVKLFTNNVRGELGEATLTVTYNADVLVMPGHEDATGMTTYTVTAPLAMDENGCILDEILKIKSGAEGGTYAVTINLEVTTADGETYAFEPTVVEVPVEGNFIRGDINDDGRVSVADVVMLLRVAAGDENVPETINLKAGDVTAEGNTEESKINTADAVLVMQYLVGKVDTL